jgi:Ca-activated chloride channel family protein
MHWGHANLLILLLLIPLAFFLLGVERKRKKQLFKKFAENRFYDFFLQGYNSFNWWLRNFLLIIALFFLIIALARPQWDKEIQDVQRRGIDIAVCIDVSKSMDATDISPSRIDRAKDQISLFIDQLEGDRIALIPFAGVAHVQCPLTDDYGAAQMFLNTLDTEYIPVYGTNVGAALKKATDVFPDNSKHKLVILVSDGEDLEEKGGKIAEEMAKAGITIYTLGIGSPEGSPIPVANESGDVEYVKDDKGEIVMSKLDVETLGKIARTTGGRFYIITPKQTEIFEILRTIQGLEKNKYSSKMFNRFKDQYIWFAILVLLLLAIEPLISLRKSYKHERFIS